MQFKCMISILHLNCEVGDMERFKIPVVPPTTNKSIRFPNDVIEAVRVALRNLEEAQ